MTTLALILVSLASVIHVYIFVLESLLWTQEKTRRTFGIATLEEATVLAPMAFNQGFYNLFLAVIAGGGVVATVQGHAEVGATLIFAGAGSMALAGIVLLLSAPSKASAALKQLVLPLLGVIVLGIALAS